jgi:integrase
LRRSLRSDSFIPVQRWLCRRCGYRFSQSSLTNKKENGHTLGYQVCADEKEVENLVAVENPTEVGQREATADAAQVKGKIIEFLWYLEKMGYEQSTAKGYFAILRHLDKKGVDVFNPETVKLHIAEQGWNLGRKANVIKAYNLFAKMNGLEWQKPRCNPRKGLPRPPSTEQAKQLIAASTRKFAITFRFMAETGASPTEVENMTEKNFNFTRNKVYIEGRKGHLDRMVPISNELAALMKTYLTKYKRFPKSWKLGRKFRQTRNSLATKLNDQSFRHIRLYDLRHYFGTTLYAKTKDILYVRDQMGHSKVETTMVYTKLVDFPQDEEYLCKVAKTVEEAAELVEAGFEYVTDVDDLKLFRKRKTLCGGPWSSQKGP